MVTVYALIATGVNADGRKEVLGLQVTSSKNGAGWLAFFRALTARGGVKPGLATSACYKARKREAFDRLHADQRPAR